MDAQVQIPSIKLAKVGRKKKKNKLIPFLPDFLGGGASPWGAGAGLSLGAKMAVVFVVSTLGVGAYQVGKTLKPGGAGQAGLKSGLASIFAKPHYGSAAGLPTNKPWYQNSLGMADAKGGYPGSMENAAAGGAASGSANGAANGAAAGAAAKAGAAGAAGASPFDALAKAKALAAAQAKAKAAAEQQGMGAGSGLGNGMGGLGANMGGPSSVAGGSSLAGLTGGTFGAGGGGAAGAKTPGTPAKKVVPFERSYGAHALGGSLGQGEQGLGAAGQLRSIHNMNPYTESSNPQMSKGASSQGFDTGQSNGSAITGAGISGGGGSAPAPSQDNTGFGGGGPTNGGFQGGGGYSGGGTTTPPPGPTAAPWAGMMSWAGKLLAVAGILLGIASALALFSEYDWWIIEWLARAACVLAGLATLMGLSMIGMGQ
ncbi:MAG: hypothetical protein KGI84_08930, partial [Elusimicrobia bacterium]|nr:hypothetical protein [Elusimicrobiota bacterium]